MKPDFKSDKYHIYLGDDDFIHVVPIGSFETADQIQEFADHIRRCAVILNERSKPIFLLYDMTKTGRTNGTSRKAMIDFFKAFTFDEMVMFGLSHLNRNLLNLFTYLLPQMRKVMAFDSEEKAASYLNSVRPQNPKPNH